ncbi:hypothetical protein BU202_01930 [Streptococcus cuniculi]|uniref:Uncharacterized protein n=1 Tax=Streptococcus cuniculi TaxID=1432788 RepID=A0A1Q8E9D1_9STRE|nr:hypothetical protein [Streptococcus cuniculi]OLF48401.1 hypothetical protein BU202_01930 [Streptococcus cuniculi]
MYQVFGASVLLVKEQIDFSKRGYFKLTFRYLPSNYIFIIENEIRLFNIFIYDEEGANISLYRIEEYNNNLDDMKNINYAINLLFNVLREDKFFLYLKKDGKYYKKTSAGTFVIKNMLEELYGR